MPLSVRALQEISLILISGISSALLDQVMCFYPTGVPREIESLGGKGLFFKEYFIMDIVCNC